MAIEHADFEGIERLSLVLGQQRGHAYINLPLLQIIMQVVALSQLPPSVLQATGSWRRAYKGG